MIISATPLDLPFKHPFGIARGVKQAAHNVLVQVEFEGLTGWGEAAPNARYGESQAATLAFLNKLQIQSDRFPDQIEVVMSEALEQAGSGNRAALAGLDMALHDWWGKFNHKPAHARWGGSGYVGPVTSFTIGLDQPHVIRQKVREAAPYPVLKIKLGTPDDAVVMQAVRSETNKPLRVDANEGWPSKEEALDHIFALQEQGVELIEQPLPARHIANMAWLKERSPLPLIADEDCIDLASINYLADGFDGINIKLDKAGGLLEGRKMLTTAKEMGLSVMIGCMGGSSISMTAGAHLALDAEWADLDGNLLLARDPYEGVTLDQGRLVLPDKSGLGVVPRSN